MKQFQSIYLFILVAFYISFSTAQTAVSSTVEISIFEKLAGIKNVVSIEKRNPVSHFDKNFEIWFEQPIDHTDLSKGTFRQRVFLGFETQQKPVFVELQGYVAPFWRIITERMQHDVSDGDRRFRVPSY